MVVVMSNRKRLLSLSLVIGFALGAASLYGPPAAYVTGQKDKAKAPSQADRKALARKPAPSGKLRDRLGDDDGYGIVAFYSADIHGNLEVCGCPIHPLGGV